MRAFAIFLGIIVLGTTRSQAYDPGFPFNQYKPVAYKNSECFEDLPGSLYTTGKVQYSCRVTALAHINSPGNPKEEFVAIACGRGDTDREARHSAWARAMSTITDLEIDRKKAKQKANLIDQDDQYVSDGMVDNCVGVPTTAERETVQREGEPAVTAPLSATPRVAEASPPPTGEAEGGYEPAPQQDPNTATFVIHNHSPYRVGVEFYSQNRNHAWPGGDRQYTVNNDGNYDLNCTAGEKICYGAWRDGNSSAYWGTGMNNSHNCQRCCITCGNSFETTLVDSGDSSGGSGLSDVLGAATTILNGAAGIAGNNGGGGGGGGGSVRIPSRPSIPNGTSSQPQSTITGH
jgi:hypothetical protein